MMIKNEILQQWAEDYIIGGKAMVVFHNDQTKVSKRFVVYAHYGDDWAAKVAAQQKDRSKIKYFKVFSLDTGPKKEFVGNIPLDHIFINAKKNNCPTELSRQFAFVWNHLKNRTLPTEYHILHMGSCSVCNRPLTDPDSILRGIGPICLSRIGDYLKSTACPKDSQSEAPSSLSL